MPSLRRTVILVAALNLAYFCVEFGFAVRQGSVSLFADSVDFMEDTALNLLILVGLSWPAAFRARLGSLLAVILLMPSAMTLWAAVRHLTGGPVPNAESMGLVGAGAFAVNLSCALLLVRIRDHAGSLTKAAFLSSRNDVAANVAIVLAGLCTAAWPSIWPDLLVGVGILVMNADAAVKVFRASKREQQAEGPA